VKVKLGGESKVDRETLPRDSSFVHAVGARRGLLELGSKTDGTGVKNGVSFLEVWDAINMLVSSIEIGVTRVTEALMPQQSFGMRVELVKAELLDRTG
jgi:hypothetical protein